MRSFILACIFVIPSMMWGQSLDRLEQLLHHSFSTVSQVDVQRAQARLDYNEKQNGVRFQSAMTNNDFAGLELGNVWRISGGVSMDFLQNGIRQKRQERTVLEIEKELAELTIEKSTLDKNYGYLFNYFIYSFNKEKKMLLHQKQLVLNSLINKNYDLYYNHELSYEEILYLQGLARETEIILQSIEHTDEMFEQMIDLKEVPSLAIRNLPIFELQIDSFLQYKPFDYLEKEAELMKKRSDYVQKLTDRQKLTLYANIHYRPDFGNQERTGFYNNFGLRYSTPLNFDKEEEKKLVELEQERIDAFNDDLIFNEYKELINLVLDYDTKLRQYSNFHYKLKKLKESQRVQGAIMQVSTQKVQSRKDWKIELEILNVEYELLGLKQLLYLAFLRIYNKARLTEVNPYVNIIPFELDQKRFKGERVLKIADTQKEQLMSDFVIDYLQKNNFKYALWLGTQVPSDLKQKLYEHGILLVADQSMYNEKAIIPVPVRQFSSRGDMELWIDQMLLEHASSYLFFEAIDELILLDSKTLGD